MTAKEARGQPRRDFTVDYGTKWPKHKHCADQHNIFSDKWNISSQQQQIWDQKGFPLLWYSFSLTKTYAHCKFLEHRKGTLPLTQCPAWADSKAAPCSPGCSPAAIAAPQSSAQPAQKGPVQSTEWPSGPAAGGWCVSCSVKPNPIYLERLLCVPSLHHGGVGCAGREEAGSGAAEIIVPTPSHSPCSESKAQPAQ